MMNPILSQALSENISYSQEFVNLCKSIVSKFTPATENIFVNTLKDFLYFKKVAEKEKKKFQFFKKQVNIASDSGGYCRKTANRAMATLVDLGLLTKYDLRGENVTHNYELSEFGFKFLMAMRYHFQQYFNLFTEVLNSFCFTTISIFQNLFSKKCPTINKSKALNTSSNSGIEKRKRSATCCLIGCKEKACILPKERAVMEIEKLREASHGPSTRHHSQNYVTNNKTIHQREGYGYVPGSVRTRPAVNTYVEHKGPEDIPAEKEKVNEKYSTLDQKRKFWGKLVAPLVSRNEHFKKEHHG